jgi:hypothetical protein
VIEGANIVQVDCFGLPIIIGQGCLDFSISSFPASDPRPAAKEKADVVGLLSATFLIAPAMSIGDELKEQTLTPWGAYVQQANSNMDRHGAKATKSASGNI